MVRRTSTASVGGWGRTRPSHRLTAIVGLAALAVVAAACGESTPLTDASPEDSPSPAPTVTVTETVSPQPASPTPKPTKPEPTTPDRTPTDDGSPARAATGLECEQEFVVSDVPPEAERIEETAGDIDGDGMSDRVLTFAIEEEGQQLFFLRVYTDDGFRAEARLDQADSIAPVRPLGAADIGAGRQVAFVQESTGASTAQVSLWGFHDYDDDPCALARVTIPDHTAGVFFPVGGSVGHGDGLACSDFDGDGQDDLVLRSVERVDDDTYEGGISAWTWPGAGALQFVDGTDEVITYTEPEDSEEIEASYSLDCPGVTGP